MEFKVVQNAIFSKIRKFGSFQINFINLVEAIDIFEGRGGLGASSTNLFFSYFHKAWEKAF